MRKVLVLLCLTIIGLDVLAYDYQAVYSHNTTYYQDDNKYIVSMRIDSVKIIDGDSIFYPLKSIRGKTDGYFTPYGASWLGDKVIVKQDYNYFINNTGDSIKIKTSAAVNDEWIVFQKNDLIVTGKVEKITEENFLNIVDSVKHISFSFSDAGITKYKNPVLISKKYGLYKSYNFYSFPNIYDNGSNFSDLFNSSNFTLAGMTNPKLGIQNLTSFDIFDFQPGDELHIKYEYYCIGPIYADLKPVNISTILKYLSRTNYPDSIVYHLLKKVNDNGAVSEAEKKQKIVKDYYLEKLPMEPIFEDYKAFNILMNYGTVGTIKFMSNLQRLHKIDNSSFDFITGYDEDGWNVAITDGCFPSKVYLEGLGGPYSNCDGWGCIMNEGLVYFKKGETEWGVPLVITGVSETETLLGAIFPNPAQDFVTLFLPAVSLNFSLTIIDKLGRIVKSESFQNADRATLNISELVSGLYFLQVKSGGKSEVHKLIKE